MIAQLHAAMTAALIKRQPDRHGALSWEARELQAAVRLLEATQPELEYNRISAMAAHVPPIGERAT